MKIAFTSDGPNWDSMIDPRFGRAEYIVVYNDKDQSIEVLDNTDVKNEAHGAGTSTAQKLYNLSPDVVITGNGPGENAFQALKTMKVQIYINAHDMTLADAYELYKQGRLQLMKY
jgi:predicted Fe-Mo cluster-binding NifX family protein